jgi:hypothetical protein
MKLITEVIESGFNYLVEDGKNGKKNHFIEGTFMQSEVKNRNNRMYPQPILAKEAARYAKEYIDKNRAYGELGHPQGPTINLERVSHMIKELKEDGNNFYGKAKIMDTPYGNIVKNLMDEGASLGVSSRGMGTLKPGRDGCATVQKDFYLATAADIVADPSAPDAYVNGVMEGREWVWDNGVITEADVARQRAHIKKASSKSLEAAKINVFRNFIAKL